MSYLIQLELPFNDSDIRPNDLVYIVKESHYTSIVNSQLLVLEIEPTVMYVGRFHATVVTLEEWEKARQTMVFTAHVIPLEYLKHWGAKTASWEL